MHYCPTDIMWADVLTKPLQGQKFRDMQAFLQNCPRDYDDDIELQNNPLARQMMNHQVTTNVSSRECVEEHSKVETAKNVPVHFSKLPQRQPQIPAKSVKTAQNVPVLFVSKGKTIQNVPVHFGSKVRRPVEDAQNVPVHFGSKVRKCPKCTSTFFKPDEQMLAK